jgi:hypothetical protein
MIRADLPQIFSPPRRSSRLLSLCFVLFDLVGFSMRVQKAASKPR